MKEKLKNSKFYIEYEFPEFIKYYIMYRIDDMFYPLENLFPIIPKYIETLLLTNDRYKVELALNLL